MILLGQDSVRPLSLCTRRVFGHDSAWAGFCSATITLFGQSVRTRFYSVRILSRHGHSVRAEYSDTILLWKDSVWLRSLCSGRVFGHDPARSGFCSATVTLFGQSVGTRFCSGRILFGCGHSVREECSDMILLGQDSVRPRSLCSGRVFGHDSARAGFCRSLPWFPPRVSFSINVFERELRVSTFQVFVVCLEDMFESSVSVSSPEEDIVISSSSSSGSGQVSTSSSEVGTSNPQLLRPLSLEPLRPSSSQPLQPLTSQRSPSLPAKNALGDVKDQAEDEVNPRPWYTADEKSSKMSTEDLVELLREYPLPVGWYARLPGLQEPANYGTKYETGIYKEQVRSGYRLPLHPFALRFFEHYHMAPGQLVPNGWRKLVGLIYLVQTSGYKSDTTDFMRVFFEICFVKGVANCPGWYYIHSRQRLLKGGPKSNKGWHSRYFFVGRSDKGKLPFDREWNPYCKDFENPGKPAPNNLTKHILSHIKLQGRLSIDEPLSEQQLEWARIIPRTLVPAGAVTPPPVPTISSTFSAESASLESQREEERKAAKYRVAPAPKKTRVIPPDHSPQIVEKVSVEEDPIFCPRWTLRSNDMYASGSEMLSRFEMARQVAAEEAQQKRDAIKEAQEATHRAEELSNREEDYLAKIATLEKRLERIKRKAVEEVTKARDQGIRDFLDGNAGDEWLKKRTEDGLEIYDLGFTKAKEMFAERFPDIPLEDFVLPAVASPSRETAMPSKAGDAAASHPPGEGPSGDAPEP
ncbi:hypothetical protein RJ639_013523 [Escallonia herrerae]|uniref:Transposase (putative) gypsy type domain-containing protein n=1 Tax=Escallonia herrerae TaxID=1293975 RepID=A0AA88VL00_9ASTE|nr:hypothetical protein RJ639_013523 [Escallonia herrerae]